jgi:hypothetical protein
VLSGLYVLYPHTMVFAFDARYLYEVLEPEREDAEHVHLRLAFGLRDTRLDNGRRVDQLSRCVALAAAALVIQIACWTWALVLL